MVLVPFAIGVGIMAYAGAVAFYTVLAVWRMRRAAVRDSEAAARRLRMEGLLNGAMKEAKLAEFCVRGEAEPQGK